MDEWKTVSVGEEPADGLGEGGARGSGSVRGLEQARRRLKPGTRVRVSGQDSGNPGRSLCLPPSPRHERWPGAKSPDGRNIIDVAKVVLAIGGGDRNHGRVETVSVGEEPADGLGEGGARESGSVRGLAQHVGRR